MEAVEFTVEDYHRYKEKIEAKRTEENYFRETPQKESEDSQITVTIERINALEQIACMTPIGISAAATGLGAAYLPFPFNVLASLTLLLGALGHNVLEDYFTQKRTLR